MSTDHVGADNRASGKAGQRIDLIRPSLIALRVLEGALWILVSPYLGKTFAILVGLKGKLIETTPLLNKDYSYIDDLPLISAEPTSIIETGEFWLNQLQLLTPEMIIGIALIAVLSWILGDLPVNAIVRMGPRARDEEPVWPGAGEEYSQFIVESLIRRAQRARRVARMILTLMVATLIVGLWVFISAPGAENAEDLYVRSQARIFSNYVEDFANLSGDASASIIAVTAATRAIASDVTAVRQQVLPGMAPEAGASLSSKLDEIEAKVLSASSLTSLAMTESDKETLNSVVKAAAELTAAVKEKATEPINSQSTLTRIGSVVILLVALKVLGSLYQSNSVRGEHYAAMADAVLMALHRKTDALDDDKMIATLKQIAPNVAVTADVTTPLELLSSLTEKLSDLAGKIGDAAGKFRQGRE